MPHPDDNEVGAGGTIAKLAAKGAKVAYLGVTDGGGGTMDPSQSAEYLAHLRRREQQAAAKLLGVEAIEWLGYRDGAGLPPDELRRKILGVIRRVRPDFVLTVDPWLPYEAHQDHRATGLAVAEACLLSAFPNIEADPAATGLAPHAVTAVAFYATAAPNQYVAIDEQTWSRRLEAVRLHESQFPGQVFQMYAMYIDGKCRDYAAAAGGGATWAEAFKVLTPLHLHMNVDAAAM